MKAYSRLLWLLFGGLLAACSAMPSAVRQETLKLPYDELLANTAQYQGKSVIVGGYVIEVKNEKDHTTLLMVQAPLGSTDKPGKKDLSKGRLLIAYKGFLDPEVYTKDRKVTVVGKLTGSSRTEQTPLAYPYLRVQVETIHLWPVIKPPPREVYWDPCWSPFCSWYSPFHHPFR